MVDVNRNECNCDGEALVAREVATWKTGNPTGVYCDKCGYLFGYENWREP